MPVEDRDPCRREGGGGGRGKWREWERGKT